MKESKRAKSLLLRQESRKALYEAGVVSNLCWTDHDIVSAVRRKAGLTEVEPWNEWRKKEYKTFRSELVLALQEAGVDIKKVKKVQHVVQGLRTLLLK